MLGLIVSGVFAAVIVLVVLGMAFSGDEENKP